MEEQLPRLFEHLEAHGSRVTWATPPSQPDLNWARVDLFATKSEYAGRFHIFLNNLRAGSPLRTAEANAFGSDSNSLEQDAKQFLASGQAHAQTLSARPLDPKHDFGEHSINDALQSFTWRTRSSIEIRNKRRQRTNRLLRRALRHWVKMGLPESSSERALIPQNI